jgi:arsenate reductase
VAGIALEAVREVGIDVSSHQPKLVTEMMTAAADGVIAMGCNIQKACPALRVPVNDWGIEDPAGKPLQDVPRIRDEIWRRVAGLLEELGLAPLSSR